MGEARWMGCVCERHYRHMYCFTSSIEVIVMHKITAKVRLGIPKAKHGELRRIIYQSLVMPHHYLVPPVCFARTMARQLVAGILKMLHAGTSYRVRMRTFRVLWVDGCACMHGGINVLIRHMHIYD